MTNSLISKNEAFDIVRQAREWLKKNSVSGDTSKPTTKFYAAEMTRLISKSPDKNAEQLWAAICDTQKKNTFYLRVAAAKWATSALIERVLSVQDQYQRDSTIAQETWLAKVMEMKSILATATQLRAMISSSNGQCPIKSPAPRSSKRRELSSLPDSWREEMAERLARTPHHLGFLIMAITGCRPKELEAGIKLFVSEHSIRIYIEGAKVKRLQGQPWRELEYRTDGEMHPLVSSLYKALWTDQAGEREVEIQCGRAALTSAIRRAGKKFDRKNGRDITPYCLRHQFASDLKGQLGDDDLISVALGQSASMTRKFYGRARSSSRTPLSPTNIHAARPVRETRLALPLIRQRRSIAPN
nr:site-specific integrase [Herbaspirillum sp. B39]